MAKPIIEAKNMMITYNVGKSNEFQALKGVDVEIYPREYIILFGPSGCGKSTLLYSILGGLDPSDGEMFVKRESIYSYTPEEMVDYQRSTVGIVYQQFNLIPSLNVLDNVALPQIFMGVPLQERSKRASQLLRRFGIDKSLEKKIPATLSGGQQQRVAVSRALVNDPEILLADEPVGNLDSISAEQVMKKLEEINTIDRKTVILVTHDAKYLPYAHRIYYLRDGMLQRIVVNPEKEQVKHVKLGETIVTEIEQLARMYPYSEPMELKVKSVVNFITQDLGFEQIRRIEKATLRVLRGDMDEFMFFEFLIKPMSKEGVGLLSGTAERMAKKVSYLIKYSKDVMRFRKETTSDKMFLHQRKFIDRLFTYITDDSGFEVSSEQHDIVQNAIAERVGGIISSSEFEQRLALSFELGGAEYKENIAHEITRYLEKLIAQGGYIIQSKS